MSQSKRNYEDEMQRFLAFYGTTRVVSHLTIEDLKNMPELTEDSDTKQEENFDEY